MKRVISLILALVLVLSLGLTGCGNKENTAETSNTPGTDATATTVSDKPVIDPLGKYSEPITITYGRIVQGEQKFPSGESYDNNIWTRDFESELGIKVQPAWESAPEAYDRKLYLSILSGELPDFFKVTSPALLQQLVAGDMVEDMTEVAANWRTPFVKGVMEAGKGLAEEQCSINGKLYAYPTGAVVPEGESFVFIRDDLRKELGFAEPQTMEDLLALGKAMVESGKVKQAFAIGNTPIGESWMNLVGFFNAYDAFPRMWIEKDGKLVYGSVQPEMKNALMVLKQAYADGLINKEFVAKDHKTAGQDMVNGIAGICFGQFWINGWPLPDAWTNNKFDIRGYAIPFSTSASVKKVQGTAVALTSNSNTYCVRKGYEHPEAIAKMSNYFVEKGYGATAEPKKYRTDGEINVFTISPVQGSGAPYINVAIHKAVTDAIDKKDPSLVEKDAQQKAAFDKIQKYMSGTFETPDFTDYKFFYGPKSIFGIEDTYIKNGQILSDAFFGAETPEMAKNRESFRTMEEKMVLDVISGAKDISEFDKFVSDWNAQGGEVITAEVNSWKQKNAK